MNEKSLKKKQSQDLATKRILAVFLAAALVLWGMSFLYDMMTYGSTFMQGQLINNALLAVSALAAVVMIVVYITAKKRGAFHEERVLNSGFFALCALAVCASSFILAMDYYNGMHILYIFLPVAAVWHLVYYVYERQFFSFSVAATASTAAAITTQLKYGQSLVVYETTISENMAWGRCDAGWVYLYYVDLTPVVNGAVDARVVYNENAIIYTDVNCSGVAGTYARMSVIDIYEIVGTMARTDKGWVSTNDLL